MSIARRLSRPGVFAWSALESAGRQLLSLALSFVTIAFISPHDLGIFSLSIALIQIFAIVVDDPMGEALLQRSECVEADWDSGYTANMVLAVFTTIIAIVLSPFVAALLHIPDLARALPAVALNILIGAFGNIPRYHASRDLRFRAVAQLVLIAGLAGGTTTLALAISGWGYWALIIGSLVTSMVATILARRSAAWTPRLRFDRTRLAPLIPFALSSCAAQSILIVRDVTIPLTVGAFSGATQVGFFVLALRLSRTLGLFFEDLTRRPLLSLISRMQDAPDRAAALIRDVVAAIGSIVLPSFTGLAIIGPTLISLCFGAQWARAGDLIPFLCFIVVGWFTLHLPSVSLRASGEVGRSVRLLAVPTIADLVLIVTILSIADLHWALIALCLRAIAFLPSTVAIMRRHLRVSGRSILDALTLPLTGVGAMILASIVLVPHLGSGWPGLILLTLINSFVYAVPIAISALLGNRNLVTALGNVLKVGAVPLQEIVIVNAEASAHELAHGKGLP